ncbi:unnamed protein product [Closterium sp. NIES-64]|nr:unnamed protein product [Closterium sp. NIES-64]
MVPSAVTVHVSHICAQHGEQLPRAAFDDFPVCQSGVDTLLETQDEDSLEFRAQEEPFEVAIQEAVKEAEEEEAAEVAAAENGDAQDPALVVVEEMTLDDSSGEEETEASLEEHTSGEVQATADDAADADERLMDGPTEEDQQQGGGLQDEVAVAAA